MSLPAVGHRSPFPRPATVVLPRLLAICLLALVLPVLGPPRASGAVVAEPVDAVWPLAPRPPVVRGFDAPASPWGAGHRGVDLLGRPGQPVLAAAAGQVRFAGRLAGRGVVVVDHGAVRTTYEPVAADVPVGTPVLAGQPIGILQPGGSHCFPRACLHWGLIRGSTYLDPLTLVGAGPVRLLPLSGARGGVLGAPPPVLRLWGAPAGMPAAVVPR